MGPEKSKKWISRLFRTCGNREMQTKSNIPAPRDMSWVLQTEHCRVLTRALQCSLCIADDNLHWWHNTLNVPVVIVNEHGRELSKMQQSLRCKLWGWLNSKVQFSTYRINTWQLCWTKLTWQKPALRESAAGRLSDTCWSFWCTFAYSFISLLSFHFRLRAFPTIICTAINW